MDRLRRSFRSSFRRRDERGAEAGGGTGEEEGGGGPARMWPADEAAVKTNNCFFEVKYLGSVEVRGELILNRIFIFTTTSITFV